MTHFVDLLGAAQTELDLADFASSVCSAMSATDMTERESAHYYGGHYFGAHLRDKTVKIMLSDDENLPFWVQISASSGSARELQDFVDNLVMQKMLPADFYFVRVERLGHHDESRILYP